MSDDPRVAISGFADEAVLDKNFNDQLEVVAGLGMRWLSLRWLDLGHGVRNAVELSDDEVATAAHKLDEHGIRVSSLASPLGKIKLVDRPHPASDRYVEFRHYLTHDVRRACQIAAHLGTRLVRAFTFYPPVEDAVDDGAVIESRLDEVASRIGAMADECDRQGLTLGLEVEGGLVGCTGRRLAEIARRADHPAIVLVFDAANLVVQGCQTSAVVDEFRAMSSALGWIHVKDHVPVVATTAADRGDESHHAEGGFNRRFVPPGEGAGGYPEILSLLRSQLPDIRSQLATRGIDQFFLDLEPHLRTGGQFGGYSGADGFALALGHLTALCNAAGLDHDVAATQPALALKQQRTAR
jgi:sugar phosphate isomerase/epimerase